MLSAELDAPALDASVSATWSLQRGVRCRTGMKLRTSTRCKRRDASSSPQPRTVSHVPRNAARGATRWRRVRGCGAASNGGRCQAGGAARESRGGCSLSAGHRRSDVSGRAHCTHERSNGCRPLAIPCCTACSRQARRAARPGRGRTLVLQSFFYFLALGLGLSLAFFLAFQAVPSSHSLLSATLLVPVSTRGAALGLALAPPFLPLSGLKAT